MFSYQEALKLVHPDLNPSIKDPEGKIAQLRKHKDDPQKINQLLSSWNLISNSSQLLKIFISQDKIDTIGIISFDEATEILTKFGNSSYTSDLIKLKNRYPDTIYKYLIYKKLVGNLEYEFFDRYLEDWFHQRLNHAVHLGIKEIKDVYQRNLLLRDFEINRYGIKEIEWFAMDHDINVSYLFNDMFK